MKKKSKEKKNIIKNVKQQIICKWNLQLWTMKSNRFGNEYT